MKTCTKCGETKPFSEFHRHAGKLDGRRSECKACASVIRAAWYAANKDRAKADMAKRYAADPEITKARNARWRVANIDKVRSYSSKWNAAHPENARARSAKWKAANPEAVRIHKQNRRARKLETGGILSKGLAARLFKIQRGKCACCGKPLGTDFHLDHIMPLALGGTHTDDNIQLLRAICNQQKSAKHPVDFMRQRGFLL